MGARFAVPAVLSMVGGYVDVICFIRYSTFVATMTGNLVITGQTFFEVIHQMAGKHEIARSSPEPIKNHLSWELALKLVIFRSLVMAFNCFGAMAYCELQRHYPNATAKTAAPFVAILALMPDIVFLWLEQHDYGSVLAMLSVSCLALSLGFTHFLCSPAAEGSRLKAVTMAATGHMHGCTKMNHKLLVKGRDALKQADWDKYTVSMIITVGMAVGAILGAAALHMNPIGDDTDDWLLVPVAITLFFALRAHDAYIPPPGGWPVANGALNEPLNGKA